MDHFVELAHKKRAEFLDAFVENIKSGNISSVPFKERPVFITPEERVAYESISNKTIAEISQQIQLKLQDIQDTVLQASLEREYTNDFVKSSGKKPLKQAFLDFHKRLQDCIDIQVCQDGLLDAISGDESD